MGGRSFTARMIRPAPRRSTRNTLGHETLSIMISTSLMAEKTPKVGTSVLDLIGNTPLLSFKRMTTSLAPVEIYAKAEWYNPGGSVKDRAALSMILDGERSGALTKDKVLIDATSG